ncbi:MAG: efflux RND transporter permease subunit, partial [Spirochaetaceae bacterium]|nr:efflux RND transporter permease subunit [Spirochaetaceae bacterium]
LLTVLTGHVFSMNTVIALVVLFGTAVNNGILLYEGILLQGGFTREAIVTASVSKLRTILVTNLTTIFALLPFAIDPWKTSSQSSLAVAIVGGLSLSMMLVLVLMPVVFSCCGRLVDRRCHD